MADTVRLRDLRYFFGVIVKRETGFEWELMCGGHLRRRGVVKGVFLPLDLHLFPENDDILFNDWNVVKDLVVAGKLIQSWLDQNDGLRTFFTPDPELGAEFGHGWVPVRIAERIEGHRRYADMLEPFRGERAVLVHSNFTS